MERGQIEQLIAELIDCQQTADVIREKEIRRLLAKSGVELKVTEHGLRWRQVFKEG